MSLARLARRNAEFYSDKPAFVMNDRVVTFAEYCSRSNRLANALHARGLDRGARMSFLSRNSLACLDVYGAAEKGGFVAAPLNFRLAVNELASVLAGLDPHVLFVQSTYYDTVTALGDRLTDALLVGMDDDVPPGWTSLEDLVAQGADTEPDIEISLDDLAYLISTSGTTGTPRAAMLTHGGQWKNAAALALEMTLAPIDRHLATMPLYHVGGRAIVLAHTLRGCTVYLHDGFDVDAVARDIERYKITTTQVVPTMVAWLLDERLAHRDFSSLRLIWYASAPMPVELLRRGMARFGSVFIQGYGQTESGPLSTSMLPYEHVVEGPGSERLGSAGRAVPGVEVVIRSDDGRDLAIGEVGEITVKSPWNMTGYWKQPELTAKTIVDGWLRTGDMGRMDNAGYVYIVDRKKDMIISGGENIFPRDVEEIIYTHPAVLEAAVVGVPDDTWGEAVKAIVARRPGATVTEAELISFCRERLAHYKCPKNVEFRQELPKTPSGKILKRVLRDSYWQMQDARR